MKEIATNRRIDFKMLRLVMIKKSLIWVISSMLFVGQMNASSGLIDEKTFQTNGQVIFAETTELKRGIFGKIIKIDDWRSSGVDPEGAVELPIELMVRFFDSRFAVPAHQYALYRGNKKPTKAQIAEAEKKDQAANESIRAEVEAAYKKAGLNCDPKTETIVHYFSGVATMTVIECLKGEAKPGDEIKVSWENVQRRVSCPPILPGKGKAVWVISKSEKSAGGEVSAKWIHGFEATLENARTARDAFSKKHPHAKLTE